MPRATDARMEDCHELDEGREEGFERKFVFDEELRFKAIARRNKLLGLWAAEKLGKTGADAEAYASEVVISDIEEAGDEDVFRKIRARFRRRRRRPSPTTRSAAPWRADGSGGRADQETAEPMWAADQISLRFLAGRRDLVHAWSRYPIR